MQPTIDTLLALATVEYLASGRNGRAYLNAKHAIMATGVANHDAATLVLVAVGAV